MKTVLNGTCLVQREGLTVFRAIWRCVSAGVTIQAASVNFDGQNWQEMGVWVPERHSIAFA
ncbi:MAG: hypothetical protein L6Q40_03440, partial [Azonexus sp.]|nr:hypothetical protein [Azonexus sp.]